MKKFTQSNKGKITAIYVCRSVGDKDKGNNSLSIAAQKEGIRYVGKEDAYRLYCDDGKYSCLNVSEFEISLLTCICTFSFCFCITKSISFL